MKSAEVLVNYVLCSRILSKEEKAAAAVDLLLEGRLKSFQKVKKCLNNILNKRYLIVNLKFRKKK